MEKAVRTILHEFPHPRGQDQAETLAEYFEAKKTQSRTNAADTADINYRTAAKIEETYKELTEREKIKLKALFLQKQAEDSGQVGAAQKVFPA